MVFNNAKTREILGKTYIHVDFHTPSYQRGVGEEFDADAFGKSLADAGVDSIAFFAKDCHGMAFYDTKLGVKHPHCKRDLLREAIEGCHRHGVRVLAYLSLAIDTEGGNAHPEWLQVDVNGNRKGLHDDNGVSWVCLNSAYAEQSLIPMVREVMENYDIDGFFFDELFYYESSCLCENCQRFMRAMGLDPHKEEDLIYFRARSCDVFAQRVSKVINDFDPNLAIVYNPTTNIIGVMDNLAGMEHSINVGGHETGWGYLNMPMEARYVRNFDRPNLGLTAIFHRRWGDFGTVKNEPQLRYEVAQMMMHHFIIGIGDHMRPEGVLEKEKMDVMGKIFHEIKQLDLPTDAVPIRDIAIVVPGTYDSAMYREGRSDAESFEWPEPNGLSGASKALLDLHCQYDVLTECIPNVEYDQFKLLILPETGKLRPETAQRVREYVKNGGKLLITGDSSLDGEKFALADVMGAQFLSHSPYSEGSCVYLALKDLYADGIPKGISMKTYSGYIQVLSQEGALEQAEFDAPAVCNRHYTASYKGGPAMYRLDSPAIVRNKYGKGECIYVSFNLFTSYYKFAYHGHRTLIGNLVKALDDAPVMECKASANVQLNLMRHGSDVYLHMSHYYPEDGGQMIPRINTMPPKIDLDVKLRLPGCSKAETLTGAAVTVEAEGDVLNLHLSGAGQYEIIKITGGENE